MNYREPGPDADAAELDAWDDHIHAQFEPDDRDPSTWAVRDPGGNWVLPFAPAPEREVGG